MEVHVHVGMSEYSLTQRFPGMYMYVSMQIEIHQRRGRDSRQSVSVNWSICFSVLSDEATS